MPTPKELRIKVRAIIRREVVKPFLDMSYVSPRIARRQSPGAFDIVTKEEMERELMERMTLAIDSIVTTLTAPRSNIDYWR